MTGPTTPHRLTKAELDALSLYAAVLCVDQQYRRVYLALKVGTTPGTGGHTWRTSDYSTIPDSGRLAADYAVLLDSGLTALLLMGFAQDAALPAEPVKAEALTASDQVSDVVHARHEPVVGHSRHDAPRDIPSSLGGPGPTSSTVARVVAAMETAPTGPAAHDVPVSVFAATLVVAALADPDDRLAAAVEDAVDTHLGDHDADCVLGECVLAALRVVALGKCPTCGDGGDPRCPRCGSDQ
jgi:hypothetical protein